MIITAENKAEVEEAKAEFLKELENDDLYWQFLQNSDKDMIKIIELCFNEFCVKIGI